MASTTRLHTTPIVCKYKNEWFVFFRYWNAETKKYVSKKISRAAGQDLNRIKDLREREAEFNALRQARETWLMMGWNPLADPEFKNRYVMPTLNQFADIKLWSVETALNHALKYKKLAVKSKYDYKKSVEYFLQAATPLLINLLPVSQLNKTHIKAVFSYLANETKLPPKNYNKRLMHIKSLLTELVEWNALIDNPAYRLKDLPEEKTEKFELITDEEREVIREYLYVENYRFFIFCITIYYTGVRPDEILSLKIKDIDLQAQTMHLKPFSNVVKNKKERYVTIHHKLLHYLQSLHLEQHPADHHVFSFNFEPGEKKMSRQIATELWNKLVMDQLGIKKYMYSLKHLGATDFIKAGASEDNLVDHLGHSSKLITRMYTQEGVKKSKQVISKTNVEF